MTYFYSHFYSRSIRAAAFVALIMGFWLPTAHAQSRPPHPGPVLLVPAPDQPNKPNNTEPLRVQAVDIQARVVGHLASTRMTLTFYNPHDRVLAGDLYAPLPEGAAVSGYALDVNGVLVDGVVVDKHEARRIFEKEVRKGVDPGLVEWVEGNHFHTRVFPIPARGTRTIRVDFVSEVDERADGAQWSMPLHFEQKVGNFSMRIEVVDPAAAPKLVGKGPAGLAFTKLERSYVAEASGSDIALRDPVVVKLPALEQSPVQAERSADGAVYFSIRTSPPPLAGAVAKAPAPTLIRLFWDASGSRASSELDREIGLVRAAIEALGDTGTTVELVVFRHEAEAAQSFHMPLQMPRLVQVLSDLAYDGGTQLATAAVASNARKADLTLLVSDGVSSFGPADPGANAGPLVAINSSAGANHAYLRHVAERTGGTYLNLTRMDDSQALDALKAPARWRLTASAERGAEAITPSGGRTVQGPSSISGKLTGDEATVAVQYAMPGRQPERREFRIRRDDAAAGEVLRREWAQKSLEELLVLPEENAARISALGKEHGIVTPGTSLLVLESLEQYVEYGVRPPASLESMRAEFDARMAAQAKEKSDRRVSKLEEVVPMWRARIEWWEKKYDYPADFRYGAASDKKSAQRNGGAEPPSAAAAAPAREMVANGDMRAEAEDRESDEVARPGSPSAAPEGKKSKEKSSGGKDDDAGVDAAVVMAAWQPDTPYLAALAKVGAEARYAEYLRQRKDNSAAPSFYLDCANFFHDKGDSGLALRILSNLAELSFEDPALRRVLAHRLAQLDKLDRAADVFEQVLRLRPEEPQSYRDLALVLARRADAAAAKGNKSAARADYQRAMELLVEVVLGRWDRFAEIETIALMELNRIYPRAREVGVARAPIDERLIHPMDVDVRIVMTWDADMTDMDLHVVEPSGEEAYYSHNRTTIGGMVTRDFTQGYGPEVYLLRRGMHGMYDIRTKFYGSSAASLQGAVTLQVDVFTNYGRPTEKRRSLTFRLTENKEMFTVGQIEL